LRKGILRLALWAIALGDRIYLAAVRVLDPGNTARSSIEDWGVLKAGHMDRVERCAG